MRSRLVFVLSLVSTMGVSACVADWPVPGSKACGGEPCESTGGSSGTDAASTAEDTPTTSAAEGPASSTTAEDETETSGPDEPGTTEPPDVDDPVILGFELSPTYISANGMIDVAVSTDHADGVRMELDTGDVIELVGEARMFSGQITAFTGLENKEHTAWLFPWRAGQDGKPEPAKYVIALPTPGSQIFWETGDLIGGGGNVAAMGVLPDGRFVELGTYFPMGEPRCYLRARQKNGDWTLEDFMPVLPTSHCTATDLTIDPVTGALHVLVNRMNAGELKWWVGEISAWGKGAKEIGQGKIGDQALALARHPQMVAVCGTKKVPTGDLDAFVMLIKSDKSSEENLFDYKAPGNPPKDHWASETGRDCVFSGDTLIIVGEAWGIHTNDALPRDRLAILEYDVVNKSKNWIIAGPGPGVQSRALAVDADDQGRYHLAGYTCLDECEPEGELRIYQPGGFLDWQASLGPLGSELLGPHDIAWSPAGYSVIALGESQKGSFVFKVQAFAPHIYEPLWTFTPNDKQELQIALAVAIGDYGEVCAGGIGGGNYPAVACFGG